MSLDKFPLVAVLLLAGFGNVSFATAGEVFNEDSFCAWAQREIVGTNLQAEVVVHSSYDDFVESKPGAYPLQVHQYSSAPVAAGSPVNRVISCKMKTAQVIEQAWKSAGEGVALSGDRSCDAVHRRMLDTIRTALAAEGENAGSLEIVVEAEELTFMGPGWLEPWPFEPLERDEAGRLHLLSKALYVPFSWWIPLPDRFKGTYYCHLVNPVYLESLLRQGSNPATAAAIEDFGGKD